MNEKPLHKSVQNQSYDFYIYFQKLLNVNDDVKEFSFVPNVFIVEILDSQVVMDELASILFNLKLGKAPGENDTPNEFYQNLPNCLLEHIIVFQTILAYNFNINSHSIG